ncbi:MAG: hypothetical protein DMD58_01960 [Gemmatimonadetes bacterium]|nr:MAG: hypothetical protein DMD58_01960 [Gemmatimonadota bacterium]
MKSSKVKELRFRRDFPVRVAVHVPGGELVQRRGFFVREMQHEAVRVLARLVEHVLEHIRQVLGVTHRIVLFSSHRQVHALILGTFVVTRNPEH